MPAIGVPALFCAAAVCLTVVALAMIVAIKMATGRINLKGILPDRGARLRSIPQLQLLAVSIATVATYAAMDIAALGQGATSLPEVPAWLLGLFGTSHILQIGGRSGLLTFLQRGFRP